MVSSFSKVGIRSLTLFHAALHKCLAANCLWEMEEKVKANNRETYANDQEYVRPSICTGAFALALQGVRMYRAGCNRTRRTCHTVHNEFFKADKVRLVRTKHVSKGFEDTHISFGELHSSVSSDSVPEVSSAYNMPSFLLSAVGRLLILWKEWKSPSGHSR